MKQPIKWHEESARNWRSSLNKEHDFVVTAMQRNEFQYKKLEFYEKQIERAKELKKDGFDSDRFMQPRPTGEKDSC